MDLVLAELVLASFSMALAAEAASKMLDMAKEWSSVEDRVTNRNGDKCKRLHQRLRFFCWARCSVGCMIVWLLAAARLDGEFG